MVTFDSEIYQKRLHQVMKTLGIYDSDIYDGIGMKKDEQLLTNPTPSQLIKVGGYFEKKYPQINFKFIIGESDNPNNFLSLSNVKSYMVSKHISQGQLSTYIKNNLNIDNGFNKMMWGAIPENNDQANTIKEYLSLIIDKDGNHTANNTVEIKKRIGGSTPKYILDPDNYIQNNLDKESVQKMAAARGYSQKVLNLMVYPEQANGLGNLLNKVTNSMPKKVGYALVAALNADWNYLCGKGPNKPATRPRIFPKDPYKNYFIDSEFMSTLSYQDIADWAKKANMSFEILMKIKKDKYTEEPRIYFCKELVELLTNAIGKVKGQNYSINDVFVKTGVSEVEESKSETSDNENADALDVESLKKAICSIKGFNYGHFLQTKISIVKRHYETIKRIGFPNIDPKGNIGVETFENICNCVDLKLIITKDETGQNLYTVAPMHPVKKVEPVKKEVKEMPKVTTKEDPIITINKLLMEINNSTYEELQILMNELKVYIPYIKETYNIDCGNRVRMNHIHLLCLATGKTLIIDFPVVGSNKRIYFIKQNDQAKYFLEAHPHAITGTQYYEHFIKPKTDKKASGVRLDLCSNKVKEEEVPKLVEKIEEPVVNKVIENAPVIKKEFLPEKETEKKDVNIDDMIKFINESVSTKDLELLMKLANSRWTAIKAIDDYMNNK